MPVFSAEHTLPACLKSILAQTFEQYELIVVNDFSTDNSMQIFRSFDDPRMQVFENKEKGIVSALNTGLENCGSDIIARMDADDVMYPRRIEKQFDVMLYNPGVTLCHTGKKVS